MVAEGVGCQGGSKTQLLCACVHVCMCACVRACVYGAGVGGHAANKWGLHVCAVASQGRCGGPAALYVYIAIYIYVGMRGC